jgi:hypothetical protein
MFLWQTGKKNYLLYFIQFQVYKNLFILSILLLINSQNMSPDNQITNVELF